MLEKILKQLDWSEKEINVYTSLLQLGPTSVRALAIKSNINRGTTYDILKSLQKRGLVAFYEKTSKQYFVAENPSQLINDLKNKQHKLNDSINEIENILPELKAIIDNGQTKPVSKLYEGLSGIKTILKDVLDKTYNSKEKIYYAYSSISPRSHIYSAMPNFTQKRISLEIKTKVISLFDGGTLHGLDERKTLHTKQTCEHDTYTFIYPNNVAFISNDQNNNAVGMIITNAGIYLTQKHIFEGLWTIL